MRKTLFYIALAAFSICSCGQNDRKSVLMYSDLQDSLELFIKQAHPINFPEEVPTLYYVLFYKDTQAQIDTVVILINGLCSFMPVNNQRIIGAGDVAGHICEVVYDGFDHLPGIVNEENLTLNLDDYKKYGYNIEVLEKPEYEDWYFKSGQYRRTERRAYKIHRPQQLERIY